MNRTRVNDQLALSYPDGFHVMDREELKKLYLDDNPNRWGIWDQEKHIIITVFWHSSNALLAALAGAKDVAKSTEKKLHKGLGKYSYRRDGFFQTTLCGRETTGFRYTYQLGDVKLAAETIILKEKTVCYTIYYYAREELALASHPVFEAVLDTMELS